MASKWLKKTFGVAVGVQAGLALFGGNLQNYVYGATGITGSTTQLDANTEYCICDVEGFLKFRDLVNNGKVNSAAKIFLTTNIDLTESGTYTNGYCDKPKSRDTNGEVTDWYEAELNEDGSFKNWKETGNRGGATHL